jgi:hypothetical protein
MKACVDQLLKLIDKSNDNFHKMRGSMLIWHLDRKTKKRDPWVLQLTSLKGERAEASWFVTAFLFAGIKNAFKSALAMQLLRISSTLHSMTS